MRAFYEEWESLAVNSPVAIGELQNADSERNENQQLQLANFSDFPWVAFLSIGFTHPRPPAAGRDCARFAAHSLSPRRRGPCKNGVGIRQRGAAIRRPFLFCAGRSARKLAFGGPPAQKKEPRSCEALCLIVKFLRRVRDSNPRTLSRQQFSRLPPSTTRPTLQTGLQRYAKFLIVKEKIACSPIFFTGNRRSRRLLCSSGECGLCR